MEDERGTFFAFFYQEPDALGQHGKVLGKKWDSEGNVCLFQDLFMGRQRKVNPVVVVMVQLAAVADGVCF